MASLRSSISHFATGLFGGWLDRIGHIVELRKLQGHRDQLRRRWTKERASALARKAAFDERERIDDDWRFGIEEVDHEIAVCNHRQLIREAERLGIPVPRFDGADSAAEAMARSGPPLWERSDLTGIYVLSRAAQATLRAEIRKEKKERGELWLRWVPFVATLAGLVGSLIGLFAIKK
jgi:post-segregation antitoxin (ccd killing protein)